MGRQAGGGDRSARDGEGGVAGRSERASGGVGNQETAQGAVDCDVIGSVGGVDADNVRCHGRIQDGAGGEAGELDDTVGRAIGAELAVADEELRLEARGQVGDDNLVRRTQGGRSADVQRAARVSVEDIIHRRQGQRARAGAGERDGGVTVGAQRTGGLGRVGQVGDVVEGAALERERRGVAKAGR